MDFSALIERLNAANAPDFELDADIASAVGWSPGPQYSRYSDNSWRIDGCIETVAWAPNYTGSIDAALTLVPEDWWWVIKFAPHRKGAFAELHSHKVGGGELAIADAGNAAIALCIAALKARAALASGKTGEAS